MTIEDLAMITQKGLGEVRGDLNEFRNEVNDRFDRIENILLHAHENRIEKLEYDLRTVKTFLKVK